MPLQPRERAASGHFVAAAVATTTPDHAPRPLHPHQHHHHTSADGPAYSPLSPDTTATTTPTNSNHNNNTTRLLPPRTTLGISTNGSHLSLAKKDDFHGQPANKKRKLSIRTANHKLESFGFSTHPQPPTKLPRDEPNGQLPRRRKTVNGVKSGALDTDEDEDDLSRDHLPSERITRATRSPVPGPPLLAPPGLVEERVERLEREMEPGMETEIEIEKETEREKETGTEKEKKKKKKKKEDKRTLRSQDEGPRLKSELALYFPNYEDVMFDVPAEEEDFLTVHSTLYVSEDTAKRKDGEPSPTPSSKKAAHPRRTSVSSPGPPTTPQRSVSNVSSAIPSVSLDILAKTSSEIPEDPLPDAHFLKSHNRAERKEKQLRNIERERAMHEKVQLERLLDGLQGHDWLRILGITGITDGEARKYESKRDYFIAEVQTLIDKFAQWKEQEKKLRLQKEAAQARQDATDEGDSATSSVEPPSSDLNASAARQLQQETVNAVKASTSKSKGKLPIYDSPATTSHTSNPHPTPGLSRTMLPPPLPLSPDIPITSFYAKRHLRDAALSKSRQTSRNITAFGHPVPDLLEQEFRLPEVFVTPDALRSNARERRRRKRESAANSSSATSAPPSASATVLK